MVLTENGRVVFTRRRRGWIHPKKPIENIYNKYNWKDVKGRFQKKRWNRYKIRCVDDHIQIWVNDIKTTDLKDSTIRWIYRYSPRRKGLDYRFEISKSRL